MILQNRCTANAAEETLLHSSLESENCDFLRGDFDVHFDLSGKDPRESDEDRHSQHEVEVLSTDDMASHPIPLAGGMIIAVTEHDEEPSEEETDPAEGNELQLHNHYSVLILDSPANKAMMSFEQVVLVVSDPGEGAEHGDYDSDVGNDTRCNDCLVLNWGMGNKGHNVIYQPTCPRESASGVNASEMLQ